MKRFWPVGLLLLYFIFLFRDFFFKGLIPVPADTLVGAYFPWLDYKWGYVVGVPVKNPIISDVFSYFFIIKHLSTDILKQGIIPYWNNYSFAGTPLFATFHSSVLSPWNLLFLLPKYLGWGMYIFSSMLFAALSMYFYLSVLVKNRLSRIIGSLVFALSGPMTTWAEFGTAVWAAGAIPLILLGLEMVIIHNKPRYYFLLIAALVLLVLSGHVQLLTYTLIIVPIYVFFRSKSRKIFILVLLSITAGLMLTAIQLLPTADFSNRSIRSEEKYTQNFNYGLIPVSQLILLWTPDFYGHPVTGNGWGKYIYHEYASFVGTMILPLVLSALFFKRSFPVRFYSFLFIFCIFFVLDQPFSHWFFSLPLPLFTYSSASRLFFLTGLSASVLVATFLDNPKWRRVLVPVMLLLLLNIIAILLVPDIYRKVSLRNSLLPFTQLTILLFFVNIKKFHRELPILLVVFVLFDFSRNFTKYNPFISSKIIFPKTPIIEYLQSQSSSYRIIREPIALLPPNTWAMYGIENIEGYDPLYLLGYGRFFHAINNQPYFNTASRYLDLNDFNPKYLNATNVKYLVTVKTQENTNMSPFYTRIKKEKYPLVFEDKHTEIYENTNVLPRAYFVSQSISVSIESDLAKILDNRSFDPTKTAVLLSSSQIATTSGNISNYSARPNTFSFTATASGSGLLVVSNSYDPGWTAAINQVKTPVYRANGGLMAISVPQGTHNVVFNYFPKYMDIALLLSGSSWLSTVTLYFVFTRKIV